MKYSVFSVTLTLVVILAFITGCTAPAPADAEGSETSESDYLDCMKTCTQYTGMSTGQCTQTCCISGCSENSPGGSSACIERCTILPVSQQSTTGTLAGTIPASVAPSGFTCEYDENLIKTSSDFRNFFNTSCYYNDYCGWWESNDLLPPSSFDQSCINCSIDTGSLPMPTHTPCPARTLKPGASPTPAVTTTAVVSSGTCGTGLTQCRVFSTDYCVDLMTDIKHCGACRKGCVLAHAENGCSGGTCFIKSCEKGWADCNGIASDGCEVDLNADDNNCGKCGKVCSLPKAGYAVCNGVNENGKCEVQYCETGWLNSNGIHEDGCEAPAD